MSLSNYAQVEGIRRVEAAAAAGAFNQALLDRTLTTMAAQVTTPRVVDKTTTLLRIEAQDAELKYIYEMDPPMDFLSAGMRVKVQQHNCTLDGLIDIIDAGAVITHLYLRKDGSEIGDIPVTRQVCER
ncbi:hypothetical protein [Breoghania sp. L-A4]|uniref:hypothetical protein n=1 Tax=Breoghania sp. L-A4 TaxID=2304600 RepID=UPI000E35F50C|nr:hypothetical protein [Breoghania sp. L-A4]AXS39599.1 hypothetical protein D1F64_05475 [Breoghania sp. L-A4]